MSSAYPISAPVDFQNTAAGDELLFNAASGAGKNKIVDFVVSAPGDVLFRPDTGTSNVLERLAIGSVGRVLTVTGTAVAAINTVQAGADTLNSMDGTYFLIDSPTTSYYVWYSTGAGAVDPALLPSLPADLLVNNNIARTGVPVTITTGDTAIAIAGLTATELNGLADFGAVNGGTDTVTVTNADTGFVAAPSDGSLPPVAAFVYAQPTPGSSALPSWEETSPGSTGNTFLAEGTLAGAVMAAGSTWVTIASTQLTWDKLNTPNHDAGGVFTESSGIFLVPSAGVYSLSASVTLAGNSSGNGGGGIPGRRAVRQARIYNTFTAATLAFKSEQAQASNLNPTQLSLVVASTSLALNDTVVLQVRHDASSSIALDINEDTTTGQGPSNYFSATKVA
jgi:hypothetical protein